MRYLLDKETKELLFGGGAGGGKSLLGCGFGIYMSLKYRDIRGVICREELKSLKETTLLTFFDLCKQWGLKEDFDYHYDANMGIITFVKTGSTIYLKELKYYPSDPDYDYLGSAEYTWGFIDEPQQVRLKAKNVILSRIRYKLAENNLTPKLILACNPSKGYLYSEFYKPFKMGTLPLTRKFVQALPTDNPFIDSTYIENLRGLDKQTRARLLYGDWEYDDDPATLCDYDSILDMFTNVLLPSTEKFLIVDVARFGDDRTVISYWEGWDCKKIAAYKKLATVPDPNFPNRLNTTDKVHQWREQFSVPLSHILVDEDGVGGGVKDRLGCKGFMGGRKPYKNDNYLNLRAQCYYFLAKQINTHKIRVHTDNVKIRELLSEELEQIKAKDRDKDNKLQIVPKDMIKERIGRSPDFADTLMMRSLFEFLPQAKIQTFTF